MSPDVPESSEPNSEETDLNRRSWVQQVGWYVVIALAAFWAIFALRGLAARRRRVKKKRVMLGPPERFREQVTYVEAAKLFVFREPGGFSVVTAVCPHLGCTVSWRAEDQEFLCPCHDSRFNRNGRVLAGPAPRPLDWFAIEEVEGKLVADLSKVVPATYLLRPRRADAIPMSNVT